MKSILILGASVMQGPAIRIAKAKGFRVCIADGNADAVHAGDADVFLHIDLKDKEALARSASGIEGLVGVFTAGTDFSASVAWVASRLGLPGLPYEVALDASDKARMRKSLERGGVPVPAFAFGSIEDEPLAIASRVAPLPLVVKPVDNMGARGCRLARSENELKDAWADAIANSCSGMAIIEEYLEGPEFSIDALVTEGHVTLRGVADRFVVFEPYFVEMGHTMPSAYGESVIEDVVRVFKAGVEALGIRNGAAKGDIKYTRQGAFVGEIAARLSGGYMSGWTYPYSSGIDVTGEAIDIACGITPSFTQVAKGLVCAERAWISIPGRVQGVYGLKEAEGKEHVKDVFSRCSEGSRVQFPCNNVQKCGNIIALAPTLIEAEDAAESAARSILIRLVAGDQETLNFIEGRQRIVGPDGSVWPPEAYSGLSAMTLASLAKMPDMIRVSDDGGTCSIAPLRGTETEHAVDWQGRTIGQALDAVAMLSGATIGLHGDTVFGASFWRALLMGGYQAGTWILDTTVRGNSAGVLG